MRVIVQSKTVPVTQAIRAFAERQVSRLLRRGIKVSQISFFIDKVIGKKNDDFATTVTCKVAISGNVLVITRKGADLYQAIVEVSRRAARHLRKLHEKRIERARRTIDQAKFWTAADVATT